MKLSGWGKYPVVDCQLASCRSVHDLSSLFGRAETLIPRGNGRSYGDAALNPDLTLSMLAMNHLQNFDQTTGLLTCEAGVLLSDILEVFVPRGWLPAVMPGTKFVTVGGMIASDVHGKNHHHSGTFGRHVDSIELALADGTIRRCSRTENSNIFHATIGGMGLTGVILSANFRLIPIETAYLREETVVAANLDQTMALFEASAEWPYAVAWVDCLAKGLQQGRALVSRAEHLKRADLPARLQETPLAAHRRGGHRVPVDAPPGLLNRISVSLFNKAYYAWGAAHADERVIHYDPFFFPLDRLLEWNRLYGRRGFVQYQCVLPKKESAGGLSALLERISGSGAGSFLTVLKLLGPRGEGLLSFPMEGYTLALDFPIKRGTLELMAELDIITARHGGRVYLAKDARTSREGIRDGYDRLEEFAQLRASAGGKTKLASSMSERLEL